MTLEQLTFADALRPPAPAEQMPLEGLTAREFQRLTDDAIVDRAYVPYQAHSETSRQAAAAYQEEAKSLAARILAWLVARAEYGATDGEIWAAFGESKEGTCRARRVGLRDRGAVVATAERRKGQTVWVAAQYAPAQAQGNEGAAA